MKIWVAYNRVQEKICRREWTVWLSRRAGGGGYAGKGTLVECANRVELDFSFP